jgi:hypothetical protein
MDGTPLSNSKELRRDNRCLRPTSERHLLGIHRPRIHSSIAASLPGKSRAQTSATYAARAHADERHVKRIYFKKTESRHYDGPTFWDQHSRFVAAP